MTSVLIRLLGTAWALIPTAHQEHRMSNQLPRPILLLVVIMTILTTVQTIQALAVTARETPVQEIAVCQMTGVPDHS